MIIYPIFYFKDSDKKPVYSRIPQGVLNINHLVRGQAPWKSIAKLTSMKPKTLILADWSAASWDKDRLFAVKQLINQLISKGFSFYLWQDGHTILLNQALLDEDTVLRNMTPASHESIKQTAVNEHQLEPAQLLVLDDYWIDNLLLGNETPSARHLSLYRVSQSGSNTIQMLPMLKSISPPLSGLIHDEFSAKANESLSIFQQHFPLVEVYYQRKTLSELSRKQIDTLINQSTLELGGYSLSLSELNSIEEFMGNDRQLRKLIPYLSSLKSIILTACNEGFPEPLPLEHVEKLEANQTNLTMKSLRHLLLGTKKLRELTISECIQLEESQYQPIILNALESIDAKDSSLENSIFEHLLAYAPALKTIDIGNCTELQDSFSEEISFPFTQLLTLNLAESSINFKGLAQLTKKAPDLQTLNISGCANISDPDERNEDLELVHLNSLDASISTLTIPDLQSILTHSVELQILSLRHCVALHNEMALNLNLSKLISLDVSQSTLPVSDLHAILRQSSQLEKLFMDEFEDLNAALFEGVHLRKLRFLSLQNNTLSAQTLEAIFNAFPAIEELCLSDCTFLNETITAEFNLSSLKVLEINKSNLRVDFLRQLVSRSTHLESLYLANSNQLIFANEAPINLNNLTNLDLSECALITANDLQWLILQVPRLNFLHLRKSISLSDLLTIDFPPVFTLERLSMDGSVSLDDVAVLSQALPHLKLLYLMGSNWSDAPLLKSINLSRLEQLNLSQSNISAETLHYLLSSTRNLKKLDLKNCLNAFPIKSSWDSLPELQYLNLQKTAVDAKSLRKILKITPNLKKVNLSNCKNLILDKAYFTTLLKAVILEQEEEIIRQPQNNSNTNKLPPKPNRGLSRKCKINTDTSVVPNKSFHTKRYFYPLTPEKDKLPAVSEYRLESYNTLHINPTPLDLDDCLILSNSDDPQLISCDISFEADLTAIGLDLAARDRESAYYICPQDFILSNEPVAVASLSPYETIMHYQFQSNVKIEMTYSLRDRFYYIRNLSAEPVELQINFLLKVNQPAEEPELPLEIVGLIDYIKGFGEGALNLEAYPNPTGVDYLNSLYGQRKGACRHRAILFKAVMAEIAPEISVYFIKNDCHDFVEFYYNGHWYNSNLGGYTGARLIIDDTNKPDFLRKPSPRKQAKIKSLNEEKELIPYRKALETWNRTEADKESVLEACQRLTQPYIVKNNLVELDSSATLQALQLSLQAYCQSRSRPYFYVHSAEDLICSAPYIALEGDFGLLKKGPGGRFYNFLQEDFDKANPPLIIINYDNFDAEEIVRWLDLLKGKADGIALKPEIAILGLINVNKADYYQEADFYSCFQNVERCSLSKESLEENQQKKAPLPIREDYIGQTFPINFFHASDWEERLLGYWVINKDRLQFKKGELIEALESGLPIELQNAPWADDHFKLFWQQAKLRGWIEYPAGKLIIPNDISLTSSEGYNWESLTHQVQWTTGFDLEAKVLNPGNLHTFFSRYHYEESSHSLVTVDGEIESRKGQHLAVTVTGKLSVDEWAMFLAACQKHQVTVLVHCAPPVSIPEEIPLQFQNSPEPDLLKVKYTQQIISNDPDTVLGLIHTTDQDWLVIDVSECQSDDLLIHTSNQFNEETGELSFQQTRRVLLNALDNHQKVILKGQFSKELCDSLTDFIAAREREPELDAALILLSNKEILPFMQSIKLDVTVENKKTCLLKEGFQADQINNLEVEHLENDSLSQLRTRLIYRSIYPDRPDDCAWKSLLKLPGGVKPGDFDPVNSAQLALAFIQNRIDEVKLFLSKSPCLCVTGLTGTGKTTFFEKYFQTEETILFKGVAEKKQWAEDQSDKIKILFIDEANLTAKQWSEFEGLFHKPPSILIDGKVYLLTDKHKVVFAFNPLSYGNSRQMASFFKNHGIAMVFEPLSQELIYETVLKPIFENTALALQTAKICEPLLKLYTFLCQCSETEVLISPRELEMMILMIIANMDKDIDPVEAACHYAWQLASSLVPEKHRQALDKNFKPFHALTGQIRETPMLTHEGLPLTKSRQDLVNQLDEFLKLREFRKNQATNETQCFGGLGGFIVEDASGMDNIELLRAALFHQGYEEITNPNFPGDAARKFYHIHPGMPIKQQISLIKKAFHAGDGILMNNMGSSARMERLFNDLLMGKTKDGKRPQNPGFFLVATKTPGKRTSIALDRRVINVSLSELPDVEMVDILTFMGMEAEQAQRLVKAFSLNLKQAKAEGLRPLPTLHDLRRLANHLIAAQQQEKEKEHDEEKEKERDYPNLSKKRKREQNEKVKEHDKGKEKERDYPNLNRKRKRELEETGEQPDIHFYILRLNTEISHYLHLEMQSLTELGMFTSKYGLAKDAAMKILHFLERGMLSIPFNRSDLYILNTDSSLGNLVKEMAAFGFLEGSGLEWNGDFVQMAPENPANFQY